MIKIYHNPRCSKSRTALEWLRQSAVEFEIIEYIKHPLHEKDLATLIAKTGLSAIQLIRTHETVFKENYKNKELTDNEWIAVLAAEPHLLQRPIIETKESAIVALSLENILRLLH